ncbi:MAG TPA: radical SAM protein [Acidobacteriota bacterium]|nr:radical SAM protein [Acidobacteriota bacterium]
MSKKLNVLLIRAKPTFMDMILGIPIGLAYIAPIARRNGHHVDIIDLALEEDADQALFDKLEECEWDVAGFSCMTAEFEGSETAARKLKQRRPELVTIFGGQHPTIVTEEVVSQDYCDFVCMAEGEDTFEEFLEMLALPEEQRDWSRVAGLAYKDREGKPVRNGPRTFVSDPDDIPLPAYDLLDLDAYATAESARYTPKYKRAIQVFTSRGCPWHCSYCHDLFGKKFRARSPEHVLDEMRLLYNQYGIREFMIEDDIFNFDMDRAKRICDMIVEDGMKIAIQFGNGVRLERLDEELVRKLAAAGTHYMAIAVESASPRIQNISRKYLKHYLLRDVLSWTRKYGIRTMGFFMIGFPTETVEEIKMTIRFACSSNFDEALFSLVIPYAGTELSRQVAAMGMQDHDRQIDHLREVPMIRSDEFDFRTLKKWQRRAYLLFFLSRMRFLRMLPKLFSVRSGMKYLKAIERNFLPQFLQRESAGSRIN